MDEPNENPRPAKFDENVKIGLEKKSKSAYEFYLHCLDIKHMALGGNGYHLRYGATYPDWTDEDFQALLDEIGGEEQFHAIPPAGKPLFYDEILSRLQARKDEDRMSFYEAINDLRMLADPLPIAEDDPDGKDLVNLQYTLSRGYPGWKSGDFTRLLEDLGFND